MRYLELNNAQHIATKTMVSPDCVHYTNLPQHATPVLITAIPHQIAGGTPQDYCSITGTKV